MLRYKVFRFFGKILIKTTLNSLLSFSHCVNYNTEWASFLCLGQLSYAFLGLDWPPTFYSSCFQHLKIYLRIKWVSCQHQSLWDIFILFVFSPFLIYTDKRGSTKCLRLRNAEPLNWQQCQRSHLQVFLR